MKRIAAALAVVMVCVPSAHSYSFTAWTTMTGAKTLATCPMVYFDDLGHFSGGNISLDLDLCYGFTDRFDLIVDAASLGMDPFAYAGSWVMPRFALTENHIVGLQLGYDTENFLIAPQYHFAMEWDRFAFEANAAVNINTGDFANGDVFVCLAPVFKAVPDIFYVFLEANPDVVYGDDPGFGLTLAPGIWLGIRDTPHQFAISCPIDGLIDGEPTFGIYAWYWWSITFGGEE